MDYKKKLEIKGETKKMYEEIIDEVDKSGCKTKKLLNM